MTDLIKAADALAELLTYYYTECDVGYTEVREALTAYRQARKSADGVKVKPLVWKGHGHLSANPDGDGCFYTISQEANRLIVRFGPGIIGTCDDWESAKSVANKHNEARIKAALKD